MIGFWNPFPHLGHTSSTSPDGSLAWKLSTCCINCATVANFAWHCGHSSLGDVWTLDCCGGWYVSVPEFCWTLLKKSLVLSLNLLMPVSMDVRTEDAADCNPVSTPLNAPSCMDDDPFDKFFDCAPDPNDVLSLNPFRNLLPKDERLLLFSVSFLWASQLWSGPKRCFRHTSCLQLLHSTLLEKTRISLQPGTGHLHTNSCQYLFSLEEEDCYHVCWKYVSAIADETPQR